MTKAEIIAELRRSAAEDRDPWAGVMFEAHKETVKWKHGESITLAMAQFDHLRTFFLLVAHALEDEC